MTDFGCRPLCHVGSLGFSVILGSGSVSCAPEHTGVKLSSLSHSEESYCAHAFEGSLTVLRNAGRLLAAFI